jgi:putative colanic acid biosynthesis acetyltransferase WcaF
VASALYRTSPRPFFGWRRFLLRLFGANIASSARPYPRARVWAPWNLTMHHMSCLADDVDCYCVGSICLGPHAIVSQHVHLCSATHDYRQRAFPLLVGAITLGRESWVAAGAYIGPGITVGEGAVVGARSTVTKDVPPWSVAVGVPARVLSVRTLKS